MRIEIKTACYNQRRYGRPWIAVVAAWPVGGRPELRWGNWIGRNGDAGALEIEAQAGDVLRHGQKDNRGGRNTESNWTIVATDGTLRSVSDIEAREHWLARQAEAVRA